MRILSRWHSTPFQTMFENVTYTVKKIEPLEIPGSVQKYIFPIYKHSVRTCKKNYQKRCEDTCRRHIYCVVMYGTNGG